MFSFISWNRGYIPRQTSTQQSDHNPYYHRNPHQNHEIEMEPPIKALSEKKTFDNIDGKELGDFDPPGVLIVNNQAYLFSRTSMIDSDRFGNQFIIEDDTTLTIKSKDKDLPKCKNERILNQVRLWMKHDENFLLFSRFNNQTPCNYMIGLISQEIFQKYGAIVEPEQSSIEHQFDFIRDDSLHLIEIHIKIKGVFSGIVLKGDVAFQTSQQLGFIGSFSAKTKINLRDNNNLKAKAEIEWKLSGRLPLLNSE